MDGRVVAGSVSMEAASINAARMKRATSMLFNVLAGEEDAESAQLLLSKATKSIMGSSASKSSMQRGLYSASASVSTHQVAGAGQQNVNTPHHPVVSSQDAHTSSGSLRASNSANLVANTSATLTCSATPAAGNSAVHSLDGPDEHRQQSRESIKAPAASGVARTELQPAEFETEGQRSSGRSAFAAAGCHQLTDTRTASNLESSAQPMNGLLSEDVQQGHQSEVVEGDGQFVASASQGMTHMDLQADKHALAAELEQLTPEVILRELLGTLFIHPARLKFEGLLGEGTYATVHRASLLMEEQEEEDAGSGSAPGDQDAADGLRMAVAVKKLKPEVLESMSDLKDFLLEVNIMRKLRHPNIVGIRGIGAADLSSLTTARSSMYVVMETMEGGTLRDLVTKQMTSRRAVVYEAKDALRWAQHIAAAMHYLHDICRPMIIHRDMKLENVLLTDGMIGRRIAKIADLGLHKRARLNTATGILTAPTAPNAIIPIGGSLHAAKSPLDDDISYYGGGMYVPGATSVHMGNVFLNPTVHPGHHNATNASAHLNPSVRKGVGASSLSQHGGLQSSQSLVNNMKRVTSLRALVDFAATNAGVADATSNNDASTTADHKHASGMTSDALSLLAQINALEGDAHKESVKGVCDRGDDAQTQQQEQVDEEGRVSGHRTRGGVTALSVLRNSSEENRNDAIQSVGAHNDAASHAASQAQSQSQVQTAVPANSAEQRSLHDTLPSAPYPSGGVVQAGRASQEQAAALHQTNQAAEDMKALPAGVATLISDPAQFHNLQSLKLLLAHADDSSAIQARMLSHRRAASHHPVGVQKVGSAGDLQGQSKSGALELTNQAAHRQASVHGGSLFTSSRQSIGALSNDNGTNHSTASRNQSAADASVHRKMLALMALDAATPQGPYCERPQGSFCPWPQGNTPSQAQQSSQASQQQQQRSFSPSASDHQGVIDVAQAEAQREAYNNSGKNQLTAQLHGMKAIPEDSRVSMDMSEFDRKKFAHRHDQSIDMMMHEGHLSMSHNGAGGTASQASAVDVRVSVSDAGELSKSQPDGHHGATITSSSITLDNSGKGLIKSNGVSGAIAGRSSGKAGAVFAEATQQVGSLMYMAPELVNGASYNQKVDVFSFGIMMWELFSGKLLAFKGEIMCGDAEMVMAYVHRRVDGEREHLPARWPQPLKTLIAACWDSDPSARPSFRIILDQLQSMEASGALDKMIPSPIGAIQGGGAGGGGCCSVM